MPTARKTARKTPASKRKQTRQQDTSADPQLLKLFTDSIRDIYWAEKKLTTALPQLQRAATSPELQEAIGDHIAVTEEQVARLEEVFGLLDENARGKKCEAMEGLVKEATSVIEDTEEGTSTRDVGIIMAAQKVEHYEIASYGSLVALADVLGLEEISSLLSVTLEEEKEADDILTSVAENNINYEAAAETEG